MVEGHSKLLACYCQSLKRLFDSLASHASRPDFSGIFETIKLFEGLGVQSNVAVL